MKNAASVPIQIVSTEGFTPGDSEQSVNNLLPNTGEHRLRRMR